VIPDTTSLQAAGLSALQITQVWCSYYRSVSACVQSLNSVPATSVGSYDAALGKLSGCVINHSNVASSLVSENSTGSSIVSKVNSQGNRCSKRSGSGGSSGKAARSSDYATSVGTSSSGGARLPSRRKTRRGTRRKKVSSAPVVGADSELSSDLLSPGYSYLAVVRPEKIREVAAKLGPNPKFRSLVSLSPEWFVGLQELKECSVSLSGTRCVVGSVLSQSSVNTKFLTLVRSVPVAELKRQWRKALVGMSRCAVPNVYDHSLRVGA